LTFIRLIGKGAFSSVWLARDESQDLEDAFQTTSQSQERSASTTTLDAGPMDRPNPFTDINTARRKKDKKLDGLKPFQTERSVSLSFNTPRPSPPDLTSSTLIDGDGDAVFEDDNDDDSSKERGRSIKRWATQPGNSTTRENGRTVAVKMMELAVCAANDRTRISFVREVEVLRVRVFTLSISSNLSVTDSIFSPL
jgi:protein-serine/threonine kinase